MQRATILKVQGARPAMVQARPAQRKATVVRSAPKDGQIDQAVKEAEEACAGGDQGEWYVVGEQQTHRLAGRHSRRSIASFCARVPLCRG
jgi:hypothetical protein